MKVEWAVVKYVADLERNEPQNVGLVLRCGEDVHAKFVGEREDGGINGTKARFADSLENYKAWYQYWRHKIEKAETGDVLDELLEGAKSGNYLLERAGELVLGADEVEPERMLVEKFHRLVTAPDESSEVGRVRAAVVEAFRKIGINEAVREGREHDIETDEGTPDVVKYDYEYQNGELHLMNVVNFGRGGVSAWTLAHDAVYAAEQADRVAENVNPVTIAGSVKPEKSEDYRPQKTRIKEAGVLVDIDEPGFVDELECAVGVGG